MTSILFVCTGNRARSQMAEGLARTLAASGVEVASAGTQPHPQGVHRFAIAALRERGIDISSHRSKRLDDVPGEFDYVITLCDDAARNCPVVPARRAKLHWSIPDPAIESGDEIQQLSFFRQIRDDIEQRLRDWMGREGLAGQDFVDALVEKVRAELARYEHPLFAFDARAAADGVEIEIRFKPPGVEVHAYTYRMRVREIEHPQFAWTLQRQVYDCLHDYVIEMFTRNPQRQDE